MSQSFSQNGQDSYVDQIVFNGMSGGFFVDVGAYDGVTFSNSYLFERERGWNGICVEPNPERYRQLIGSRRSICVQGCVAAEAGEAEFVLVDGASDMLSGLASSMPKGHHERISQEIEQYGGRQRNVKVTCYEFNELMEMHNVKKIDYLSIDTEGGEYEVMKAIDFSRFAPRCVSIEENKKALAIWLFLKARGYVLAEKLGGDLIFVQKDLARRMRARGQIRRGKLVRRFLKSFVKRRA